MIAAGIWFIWKARCDFIFKNKRPCFVRIARMAVDHAQEFSRASCSPCGKSFFIINKPDPDFHCIYSFANYSAGSGMGGAGFSLVDSYAHVSLAGNRYKRSDSCLEMELFALSSALLAARSRGFNIQKIFPSCLEGS